MMRRLAARLPNRWLRRRAAQPSGPAPSEGADSAKEASPVLRESDADPPVAGEPSTIDFVAADSVVESSAFAAAAAAPRFAWTARERTAGEAEPVTIGTPSTFGAADWWASGWWPAVDAYGDVHADLATIGVLAVAGVSLRGNKHRYNGEACEDAFHLRPSGTPDKPFLCVAVCDGVGSSAHSRVGAAWLSRLVTDHLARAVTSAGGTAAVPGEAMLRLAVGSAVRVAHERAEAEGFALSDLQTTLTFAVIPAGAASDCTALVGQIGDSPAFVGTTDGWALVGDAGGQDELILSTRTHDAMSSDVAIMPIIPVKLDAGGRLLLCSDGVGNFIRSAAGVLDLGTHLAQALRAPVPLVELIRQADFDLRSADDDRTMVLVWRQPVASSDR